MRPELVVCFLSLLAVAGSVTITGSPNQYVKLNNDSENGFELIILHNNDMHGRFDETDEYTNQCNDEDRMADRCFGGFARISSIVRKYRAKAREGGPPVLYLNAGDTYTGTPWFSLYKENITTEFMNVLRPDVMALGNHEFDYGIEHLIPHLKNVRFPVVSANMNYSGVPEMRDLPNLRKSVVLDIRGVRIGIVGYITPETSYLSLEEDVYFSDEIAAINEEAQMLHDEKMARIIIALGHSGIERDEEIAQNCPLCDIVVGGHSHTYIGEKQGIEMPYGPYPTVVRQKSGKRVPIVQAYAYTKYMGYIKLVFDESGNLQDWNGRPILLDHQVEKDQKVQRLLEKYRAQVEELGKVSIGQSLALLDGHSCRFQECNLGNLITDAMVYQHALSQPHSDGWSDTSIGLIQSGGIRASIDGGIDITKLHINTVLPFGDRLVVEELTGTELKETLEWSVHRYQPPARNGEFLQVSGLRVVFNVSRDVGDRVSYLEALCSSCFVPEYFPVEANQTYKVIMNEYLFHGGDGHSVLKHRRGHNFTGVGDVENIISYIKRKSFIRPHLDGRIMFDPEVNEGSGDSCDSEKNYVDLDDVSGSRRLGTGSGLLLVAAFIFVRF